MHKTDALYSSFLRKGRNKMALWAPLAFAFFFLGDANDVLFHRRFLRFCFPLGLLLLVIYTVLSAVIEPSSPLPIVPRLVCGAFALVFLLLTLYSLFFALPVKEAYATQGEKRSVRTGGVYALCRHPGVLFFIPLYLLLWLSAGITLLFAATAILMNILLAFYEDIFVFPKVLDGYDNYRHNTPFLIPNPTSIRSCFSSI
jgi:protein-S-isoprenylcysteine O-methyltransferase Ste14